MAEVIGVVASAITFGSIVVQVTTSIKTLKNYWEQVRDAPEDLKWLIRDIEMFSLVLADVESDLAQESVASSLANSRSAMQSFKLCKEASEELDILVRDLGRDVNSSNRLQRSYAAVKMAMQKSKMEKYRSRLKSVTGLLMLSQQCYTRALVQAQHELITKNIALRGTNQSNDCNALPFCTTNLPSTAQTEMGSVKKRRNQFSDQNSSFTWRFSVPSWMATKVLELAGLKAPDGWKFAFRTYNTISSDSKAISYAMDGNIQGLQDLFTSRQASPFDRDEKYGYTLLHYAVIRRNPKVSEFLLNQGADPSIGDNFLYSHTPFELLLWIGSLYDPRLLLPVMRIFLSLSEVTVYDTPEEVISGVLSCFHGTAEEFKFLQQKCCPNYYQMPQFTRTTVAIAVSYSFWAAPHMPELIRVALGEGPFSADDLQSKCAPPNHWDFTTLVHSIARHIGRSLAVLSYGYREENSYERKASRKKKSPALCAPTDERKQSILLYKSWHIIFCEFLSAEIDIHNIVRQSTPFLYFLHGYFYWYDYKKMFKPTHDTALRIWLGDLQTSGVDLKKFGHVEWYLLTSGFVDKDLNSNGLRLINFTYGSSPDDWHLWISERSDSFVGDFWALVKRQGEMMPGAWPEDLPYKM